MLMATTMRGCASGLTAFIFSRQYDRCRQHAVDRVDFLFSLFADRFGACANGRGNNNGKNDMAVLDLKPLNHALFNNIFIAVHDGGENFEYFFFINVRHA